MMKNLFQFNKFDIEKFLEKKELTVKGTAPWDEYGTENHLGTMVDVFISKDETEYYSKKGEQVSNLMEPMKIKVAKDVTVSIGEKIELVNPTANAYGKKQKDGSWSTFKDQLSVKCDDITVV